MSSKLAMYTEWDEEMMQMSVGTMGKWMEHGGVGAVTKVPKSEKMKIHELSDAPERKPASVDAKLAETSILPGSPTGGINLPPAGCSSGASDK